MNPERNYKQQKADDAGKLETVFYDLKNKVTGKEFDPQNFNLIKKLNANGLLGEKFEEKFNKWPESIRHYIEERLLDYIKSEKVFEQDDLKVISGFFETALRDSDICEKDSSPDKNWVDAMKSLAHELRNYYGLQENDGEELPCWRRG